MIVRIATMSSHVGDTVERSGGKRRAGEALRIILTIFFQVCSKKLAHFPIIGPALNTQANWQNDSTCAKLMCRAYNSNENNCLLTCIAPFSPGSWPLVPGACFAPSHFRAKKRIYVWQLYLPYSTQNIQMQNGECKSCSPYYEIQ